MWLADLTALVGLAAVCGLVWFLVRWYALPSTPLLVKVTCAVSWFITLIICVLLPVDLMQSAKSRNYPGFRPPNGLMVCWDILYWLSFVLTWVAIPLLEGFYDSGRVGVKQRLLESLRVNLKLYLSIVVCVLVLFLYMAFAEKLGWSAFLGMAMSLSNAAGLILVVLLLGYGLVEVPRACRRMTRPLAARQALLSQLAAALHERDEAADVVIAISKAMSVVEVLITEQSAYPLHTVYMQIRRLLPGPQDAAIQVREIEKLCPLLQELVTRARRQRRRAGTDEKSTVAPENRVAMHELEQVHSWVIGEVRHLTVAMGWFDGLVESLLQGEVHSLLTDSTEPKPSDLTSTPPPLHPPLPPLVVHPRAAGEGQTDRSSQYSTRRPVHGSHTHVHGSHTHTHVHGSHTHTHVHGSHTHTHVHGAHTHTHVHGSHTHTRGSVERTPVFPDDSYAPLPHPPRPPTNAGRGIIFLDEEFSGDDRAALERAREIKREMARKSLFADSSPALQPTAPPVNSEVVDPVDSISLSEPELDFVADLGGGSADGPSLPHYQMIFSHKASRTLSQGQPDTEEGSAAERERRLRSRDWFLMRVCRANGAWVGFSPEDTLDEATADQFPRTCHRTCRDMCSCLGWCRCGMRLLDGVTGCLYRCWWHTRVTHMRFLWRLCYMLALLGSAILLWCEVLVVLPLPFPVSPLAGFSTILQSEGNIHAGFFGEFIYLGLTAAVLFYMVMCCLYGLFAIPISTYYRMNGGARTETKSLLANSIYSLRLMAPLCYNFLSSVALHDDSKATAFGDVLGRMKVIPFLGSSFQEYLPVLIALIVAATYFEWYGAVMAKLGVATHMSASEPDQDVLREGQLYYDQFLRRHHLRNLRDLLALPHSSCHELSVRGSGRSVRKTNRVQRGLRDEKKVHGLASWV